MFDREVARIKDDRTDPPVIHHCLRCGAEWPSNLLNAAYPKLCLLCDGELEPVPVGRKPPG
jgi:hypothetical protein